jgi:hypothetical protein
MQNSFLYFFNAFHVKGSFAVTYFLVNYISHPRTVFTTYNVLISPTGMIQFYRF